MPRLLCFLQFLQLTSLTFLLPQLFRARNRTPLDRLLTTNQLESVVEKPLRRMLDRLIEHIRQERHRCQTKL